MIGAGETVMEINKQIEEYNLSDKVIILSNRTDILILMKIMDVFVFPSITEGLGIALIEAQVSGIRCVASSSVPQEAFITNLATPLKLDAPISEWVSVVLDDTIKGPYNKKIENYDINNEINRLASLYRTK